MNPLLERSAYSLRREEEMRQWMREAKERLETRNRWRVRNQLKILCMYLEEHDPKTLLKVVKRMRQYSYLDDAQVKKCLMNNTLKPRHLPSQETRRLIRKMMGETHWTLYLEYYKQYCQHRGDRTKIQLGDSDLFVPLPPPLPTLSLKLDENVTSYIFSFLSGKDMYEASKVSRSFRDALIPRQKNVTLDGFSSLESFRQMNFIGMEYFVIGQRNSLIEPDEILSLIANDRESYPNLSRVSLRGFYWYGKSPARIHARDCPGLEESFAKALGPRLEKMAGHAVTIN